MSIVLQEVTPAALEIFLDQPWVRDRVSERIGSRRRYRELRNADAVPGPHRPRHLLPAADAAIARIPRSGAGCQRRPADRLLFTSGQRQVLGAAARLAVTQNLPRAEVGRRCRAARRFQHARHGERPDRPAVLRRMAHAAAARTRFHRRHVDQSHALGRAEQEAAGAVRPRAAQGNPLARSEYRAVGHAADLA